MNLSELSLTAASLIEFITDQLLDEGTAVAEDTELLLSGMVDSLGVIQIVDYVESETGTAIDPGDVILENFQSVAAILTFMER